MSNTSKNLLHSYKGIEGIYDEVFLKSGHFRGANSSIYKALEEFELEELRNKKEESQHILKEKGVTYNIYSKAEEFSNIWPLDILPIVIHSNDWSKIERGLEQRGRLFSLLLKDIYLEKKLLFEKVIPPEIILSFSGFLRQIDRHPAFLENPLTYFATDFIRDKNGHLFIIGDKVQAPSGSGYVLENRIVSSRIFPEIYKKSKVRKVDIYFDKLKKALLKMIPAKTKKPLIVVLTPGPKNEAYFDHLFFAENMEFVLAEGRELTVRNNKVYLKTVDGFEAVHLVLKRVNDTFMDPLELRGDSLLGVPGIVESSRASNVVIANMIGGSVLENRGILAYMEKICRFFLNEDLLLPAVPSYWLGNPEDREMVLSNLSEYAIKFTQRDPLEPFIEFGNGVNEKEIESITQKILYNPGKYVAQKIISGSTSPVFNGDKIQPGRLVMRAYTVRAEQDSYLTMPGGLIRVNNEFENRIVRNQTGAGSKDLWIVSNEERLPYEISSGDTKMKSLKEGSVSSRIADNFYWMGRYAERSEILARFLKELYLRTIEIDSMEITNREFCFKTFTYFTSTYPGFLERDFSRNLIDLDQELYEHIASEDLINSLSYNILNLLNSVKTVRDRLSEDSKNVISNIEKEFIRRESKIEKIEYLSNLITLFLAFSGFISDSMSRDSRWHFLELGRRMEKAINILRIIKSALLQPLYPFNTEQVLYLIKTSDIHLIFRGVYEDDYSFINFFNLLLFEKNHPRCFAYQIQEIQTHLESLNSKHSQFLKTMDKLAIDDVLRIYTSIDLNPDSDFWIEAFPIINWVTELHDSLTNLSNVLSRRFFQYIEEVQTFQI